MSLSAAIPGHEATIAYYDRAYTRREKTGRRVEIERRPDGFAAIQCDGCFDEVVVSSFSWLALAPLISPVVGLLGFLPMLRQARLRAGTGKAE